MKILIQNGILARRADKSGKPYWNPMRRVGHVRCPKLDSPVCKTRYSGFDRIDN
jgi:hypothetical protein